MQSDKIRVSITDLTGEKRTDVTFRTELSSHQVIDRLIKVGFLSEIKHIEDYIITIKRTGYTLSPNQTFSAAGVEEGDILIIGLTQERANGEDGSMPPNALPDDIAKELLEQLRVKLSVGSPLEDDDIQKFERLELLLDNIEGYLKPSAPIILDTQSFAIRAVRADMLNFMEDYRSDESKWFSVAWAFLGAILGMVVNWFTPNFKINTSSIILLFVFGIITIVSWLSARDYGKRAEKLKSDMLLDSTEIN